MTKTAFVVLGMHRSGTSSVAGALARLGITPPTTLLAPKPDNPKGFWESRVVMRLNNDILDAGGLTWRDWRAFRPETIDPQRLADLTDQIATTVEAEFGGADQILLKDPRMCRLVPLWEPALEGLGYQSKYILPLRSPLEVMGSLGRLMFPAAIG